MKQDPHEDHKLAADPAHAATVRQMHRRLIEVMETNGDRVADRFRADSLAPIEQKKR